jgi:hypothetical protein
MERTLGEMAVYMARPGVREVMTREELGVPDVQAGAAEMLEGASGRRAELWERLQ